MARKRYSPEQIISKLREAEVTLATGLISTNPDRRRIPLGTPARFTIARCSCPWNRPGGEPGQAIARPETPPSSSA
jgi:hypothetical protein